MHGLAIRVRVCTGLAWALWSESPPATAPCPPAFLLNRCAANGATALLSGILRGSGRQKVGAIVNGAANYGVGLPLQLLLAFRLGGGVAGLWWGIAVAATLQAIVLAVLVSRFDWQREAARAAKLVRHLSQASLLSAERQQRQAAAPDPAALLGSPVAGSPPLR